MHSTVSGYLIDSTLLAVHFSRSSFFFFLAFIFSFFLRKNKSCCTQLLNFYVPRVCVPSPKSHTKRPPTIQVNHRLPTEHTLPAGGMPSPLPPRPPAEHSAVVKNAKLISWRGQCDVA